MGYAEWFQPDSSPSHSSYSCPLMTWPHKNHCTPFRKSAKSKEMKAPSALPVSHHDGKDTSRHRPTQGWTVDEASLLCKANIYSPTVQPWVGRWRHTVCPPGKQNETCTWGIFFSLVNTVRLQSDLSILHFPYQHTFSGKKDGERLCHAIFKDTFPRQFNAPSFPVLPRTILSKQTEAVRLYRKTPYRTSCHLQDNCAACVDAHVAFDEDFSVFCGIWDWMQKRTVKSFSLLNKIL